MAGEICGLYLLWPPPATPLHVFQADGQHFRIGIETDVESLCLFE
jgi:hypothetical protein